MPHAVIRISEQDRPLLDAAQLVLIRSHYAERLASMSGYPVVLYQSIRHAGASAVHVGYLAYAHVEAILFTPDSGKKAVFLRDIVPIRFGLEEETRRRADMDAEGWHAAADVREISDDQFLSLLPLVPQPEWVPDAVEGEPVNVRLRASWRPARKPEFRARVYRAYEGRCAISGVRLVSARGLSGLEAAHIVPWAMSPHERASAGILLTPGWHCRFDVGTLVIHDDLTWTTTHEDIETLAITDRRLRAPRDKADAPDVALLRWKRALLGV